MGERNRPDVTSPAYMKKIELQRRLQEKRDDITRTVDEIRYAITDEVDERRNAVKQAVDWKFQVRKNPVAFSGAALAAGFFIGAALGKKRKASKELAELRRRAENLGPMAQERVEEWNERRRGRTSVAGRPSFMASTTELMFREIARAAQGMIVPTVLAAITGKMVAEKKTDDTLQDNGIVPESQAPRTHDAPPPSNQDFSAIPIDEPHLDSRVVDLN